MMLVAGVVAAVTNHYLAKVRMRLYRKWGWDEYLWDPNEAIRREHRRQMGKF